MRHCTVCREKATLRSIPPANFWERRILSLVSLYPFRCQACQSRVLRFEKVSTRKNRKRSSGQDEPRDRRRTYPVENATPFDPSSIRMASDSNRPSAEGPSDSVDFQQLIRDMRRAEREVFPEDPIPPE